MASRVQYLASFAADTGAAESNVKRYASQIDAANATLKAAEKAAKESFQSQTQAIKATSGSTDELRKAQQEYFQQLVGIRQASKELGSTLVEANRGAVSTENAKAEATRITTTAIEAQTQAIRANAAAEAASGAAHAVSNQSAASGAVQLLEGRSGIRSIENLLGNTLGLGGLFQVLFPITGAILVGKQIFELGEKLYEVRQKGVEAGKAISHAFGELNATAQTTITDLDLQAAKLQQNIDKLSGHPGNGLAVALAEAKKAADALLVSLREDQKAIAAVFKQNSVSSFQGLLSGQKPTGEQERNINKDADAFQAQIAQINLQQDAKLASAQNDSQRKSIEAERDQLTVAAFDHRIGLYKNEVQRQTAEQAKIDADQARAHQAGIVVGNPGSNEDSIKELNGVISQYENRRAIFQGAVRNANLTEQELQLKGDKERAEAAKRGAAEVNAAERKAAEDRRKVVEERFSDFASAADRSYAEIFNYWNKQLDAEKIGSANYQFYVQKEDEALKQGRAEQERNQKTRDKLTFEITTDAPTQQIKEGEKSLSDTGKQAINFLNALHGVSRAQSEANLQVEEASLRLAEASGQISKYDAALQQASINARRFALDQQELDRRRTAVADPDSLVGKTQIAQIDASQQQLSARIAESAINDQAAIAAQSFGGAFNAVNERIVAGSRDTAAQLAEIYGGVLQGVNSDLANTITTLGERSHRQPGRELSRAVGGTLRSASGELAGYGLKTAESSLFGAFGAGSSKPDGSRSNKFWVQMDSGSVTPGLTDSLQPSEAAVKSLAGGLTSLIPGGSFLSGLFGGGRAIGGSVNAGTTYLVGENGPEPFTPGMSGAITPTRTLRDALGQTGTASYTINMEAGVTPEQFYQGLDSALRQFHPRVVKDAVKAGSEAQRRAPSRLAA